MSRGTGSKPTVIRFAFAAMLVAVVLFLVANVIQPTGDDAPVIVRHDPDQPVSTPLSNEAARLSRANLDRARSDQDISASSIEAVASVAPAVVVVHRTVEDGSEEVLGSGVAIDDQGHVLASLGTTGSDGSLSVTWPSGVTVDARIIRIDERYQVALLEVAGEVEAFAPLATYPSLSGDRVLAIGSPLEDFTSTVTAGIIGAVGITMPETLEHPAIPDLYQHDASLNPGNEGGPIVDLNGNVVGINIGSIVVHDGEIVQGLSFAVPVTALAALLAIGR